MYCTLKIHKTWNTLGQSWITQALSGTGHLGLWLTYWLLLWAKGIIIEQFQTPSQGNDLGHGG